MADNHSSQKSNTDHLQRSLSGTHKPIIPKISSQKWLKFADIVECQDKAISKH